MPSSRRNRSSPRRYGFSSYRGRSPVRAQHSRYWSSSQYRSRSWQRSPVGYPHHSRQRSPVGYPHHSRQRSHSRHQLPRRRRSPSQQPPTRRNQGHSGLLPSPAADPDVGRIANLQSLVMALPSDPSPYYNPSVTMRLPFLGLPKAVQPDRMHLSAEGEFVYYGRAKLEAIYKAVGEMRKYGYIRYFLHGPLGVGKSHLVAALACLLTRNGKKVAFIPDCRALVKDPLYGLQFALKFAFHGHQKEIEEIARSSCLNDIYLFCRTVEAEHPIYFLLDQCNALDYMPGGIDRIAESSKETVRTFLDMITEHHFKISSATTNYQNRVSHWSEQVWYMNHGLSEEETEMTGWWQHQGRQLYQMLNPTERMELQKFTGGLPILLRIFGSLAAAVSESSTSKLEQLTESSCRLSHGDGANNCRTIEILYDKFWASSEALKILQIIREFIESQRDRLVGSNRLHKFRAVMESCLMEKEIEGAGSDLLDFRFFHVGSDRVGKVTCDFVRLVVSRYIRKLTGIETLFSPISATTLHPSTNPSVLGYQVEAMVLSHIAQNGLPEAGLEFQGISRLEFFSGKNPQFSQHNGMTLYLPAAFIHRAVDGVLVYRGLRREGGIKAVIAAIQITISGQHKDTAPSWLAQVEQWGRSLEADVVEYRFCWILENFKHGSKPIKEVFELNERAGKLVWPAHERLRIEIAALNPVIGRKLRWR